MDSPRRKTSRQEFKLSFVMGLGKLHSVQPILIYNLVPLREKLKDVCVEVALKARARVQVTERLP